MANFKVYTTKDNVKWNSYITKLPTEKQDIYYSPEYYRIYQNYGDGEAFCFVYHESENIALYPFLKNSVNQLGFKLDTEYYDIQGVYGYNGIISNSNEESFRLNFFGAFNNFCQEENIIAEFTRFHPLLNNHSFSEHNMTVIKDRKTVALDIKQSEEDIWKNSYSSNNRNMIRKALKNEVQIIETTNQQDYLEFYKIYVETMNNVNSGTYLYFNETYFTDFIKYLPQNHILILAKLKDTIIGGMILMFYGNYAHYHLSARKTEYSKYALNNLFLDYSIKKAKQLDCKLFHFGGGISREEDDSLLKFKSNFSKDEADFYIGKKVHDKEIYSLVIEQWKKNHPKSYGDNKEMLLGYREI